MTETGLVVARFRRHALVESQERARFVCQLKTRNLKPVVGDHVDWRRETEDNGTLESVHARTSELKRIDARGRAEIVAANLTQLVVVTAAAPPPDWFLLDRYLCAGELTGLKSTIVFNKTDLTEALPHELNVYADLDYRVVAVSVHEKTGLKALDDVFASHRSVMIGQSGVGKSSLTNALMGDDELQKVGELTEKAGQGRHTTTTAVLHRLPNGGELIDSPGVRDYAPFIEHTRDVQRGFREIAARSGHCRFDDCRHLAEPECAVKKAIEEKAIDPERYESYKRLFESTESLRSAHGH